MYVPAWPGLRPQDFLRPPSGTGLPFPLSAPHVRYFYRARAAIYHLFRALGLRNGEPVLVPDYHSGNEVWAVRAAGATIRYYHIRRNLEPDLDQLERLCRDGARALLVIHYLGWPQPMKELTRLAREHEVVLVEDCALSLLAEAGGQPLGTFGDYAIFCLYKTLPTPNGGLLVQNGRVLEDLAALELRPPSLVSVAGRSLELGLEGVRSRFEVPGRALFALKRAVGSALSALRVERTPVGDIGFDLAGIDLAMSRASARLLPRFDYEEIRKKRRENFRLMRESLADRATPLFEELDEGTCPLFFPLLVPHKQSAAEALWRRGIGAVQFWNYGDREATGPGFEDARFLRDHVLELPIHQDVTASQIQYMAETVARLGLRW